MKSVLLLTLFSVALSAQAPGQPDGSANRAAMEKMRFIEGRWTGEAWWQRGPNDRATATMVETVERKLDGTALLIEGRGVTPVPGGGERVVHHALAVLSYDDATKKYVMRSWLTSGLSGEFTVTLKDNELWWEREVPGGRVRNIAKYTATEWHETGEFSRDGATWSQIMDIRLKKDR